MSQTTKTSLANRLATILTRLNNHERLSVPALAEEFGVSVRSIQRDLNKQLSFLPIKKDADGCYVLEEYALGSMSFTDIQNFASMSGITELYPSLDYEFIKELLRDRFRNTCLVKDKSAEDVGSYKELFYRLSDAIKDRYEVCFYYANKPREKVKGYKLVNNDGVWYFIADDGGKLKHFSLAKIEDWVVSDTKFVSDEKFVKTIAENTLDWFSAKPIEVTLQIDTKVADYFLRRKILANQNIIENSDKHLILSTKVAYDQEIFRIVRAWIPHIKILTPKDWQDKLEDTLKEYLKYNDI